MPRDGIDRALVLGGVLGVTDVEGVLFEPDRRGRKFLLVGPGRSAGLLALHLRLLLFGTHGRSIVLRLIADELFKYNVEATVKPASFLRMR